MGWFRTHVLVGSRLALGALALQLLVSFSHVHLGDLTQASERPTGVTVADKSGSALPEPSRKHDPVCDICVLIQLASGSVAAAAPMLSPPDWFEWTPPQASTVLPRAVAARLSFRARAPPADRHQG
jgi:hypothetical protein